MDKRISTEYALGLILTFAIFVGGYFWLESRQNTNLDGLVKFGPGSIPKVESFNECVQKGFTVTESYPRKCKTSLGKEFIEEIKPSSETTNWQTYENKKYKYSINYPNNMSVDNPQAEEAQWVSISRNDPDGLLLNIGTGNASFTGKDIEKDCFIDARYYKTIIVDENEVALCLNESDSKTESLIVLVSKNKNQLSDNPFDYILIEGQYEKNRVEKYRDLFEKIVSTFKFNNTDDISNWQTYRNDKYGFEFKYPEGYNIESDGINESWEEWSIKKVPPISIDFKIINWNTFKIEDGTPGTFYQKIARSSWKYIIDNFDKIKSGECSKEIEIEVSPITAPEKCNIQKGSDYIMAETENSVIFYNKDFEISFSFSDGMSAVARDILSTFKFIN